MFGYILLMLIAFIVGFCVQLARIFNAFAKKQKKGIDPVMNVGVSILHSTLIGLIVMLPFLVLLTNQVMKNPALFAY